MQRLANGTQVAALPAPLALTGTPGFATDGNPATNLPPSEWDNDQYNRFQEEIAAPIEAAGIVLDPSDNAQLLAAIRALIKVGANAAIVGASRSASMSVAAASSSATFTADELIVATAFGGIPYLLPNFSESINLATVGAGGMDIGVAPVSGYVALYAIYNPTTGAAALLATNATSSVAPSIYGGSSMPAGYTASALVSVWSTNSSGTFDIGYQSGRQIWVPRKTALSTTVQAGALTAVSIAGVAPPNARTVSGDVAIQGAAAVTQLELSSGIAGGVGAVASAAGAITTSQITFSLPVVGLSRSLSYLAAWSGSGALLISISGYTI